MKLSMNTIFRFYPAQFIHQGHFKKKNKKLGNFALGLDGRTHQKSITRSKYTDRINC